jgi:hypothetical protein
MKAKSTQSFNAMGVIAPEAGMMIDTENAILFAQLKNMGFIEPINETGEVSEDLHVKEKKSEAKRARKK